MGKVIVLRRDNVAREHHPHLLVLSVVEREVWLVAFQRCQRRRAVNLLPHHLHHVGERNGPVPRLGVGVGREPDRQRLELVVQGIGHDDEPLVFHGHPHGVGRLGCHNHVLGHSGNGQRHLILHLISLVERHHQPEDATEREEEEKNQKLLAREVGQEAFNDIVYASKRMHQALT